MTRGLPSLVLVIDCVLFVLDDVVVHFLLLIFLLLIVLVVIEVVILVGGVIEIAVCLDHETLAALRTGHCIALLEVGGVDFVEFTLGTGRHAGSMERFGRALRPVETPHPQADSALPGRSSDYIGISTVSATSPTE